MARFMVKASEYKNVCKAVNDRKFAEFKKEIIEILKKQDVREFNKAIDWLCDQEHYYTHLEKSVTGKWIEKAGYGIGTVRTWKGKKYKKIAPGKWVRVFDKEGRGTSIAIGKLIAQVNRIPEGDTQALLNFVLANKQRFVDANGVDLPILDKLRAAVDARNNGTIGSKETSKPMEPDQIKKIHDKIEENKKKGKKVTPYEAQKQIDDEELMNKVKQIQDEAKKKNEKPSDKTEDKNTKVPFGGVDKDDEGEGKEALAMADKINEVAEKGELKVGDATFKVDKEGKEWAVRTEIMNAIKCKEGIEKINKDFEKQAKPKIEEEMKRKLEKIKEKLPDIIKEGKLEENKKIVEERLERANSRGQGMTIDEVVSNYKKDLINKIENKVKEKNGLFSHKDTEEIDLLSDVEHQIFNCTLETSGIFYKECKKLLEEAESEAEKHQNRSEAMKGNKNAYKGISELEKMTPDSLQEYVDEMHNKIMKMDHKDKGLHDAIETWKNAERIRKEKLQAANELSADFKTKLMNQLQEGMEKQKEACKDWNLKEMTDWNLERYITEAEKWKDKGLVHLADPIIDKWEASGKETYDNNDFVGPAMDYQAFAVAHSGVLEKMKKELEARKNPKSEETEPEKTVEETKETVKEEKPVKTYNYENSGKPVSFDELKPIASNKSVGENEVQLPYSKDLANEIKSLEDCVVPKWDNKEFMKHVYYEGGKLITTDGRRMKLVDVGELEGIPDGSYVDITTNKSGINIKKREGMEEYKFPNYKRVIPEDLNQKATLDTKLVKDKIKEMQKDGAISRKGINVVQLEFRDGKVFIEDTAVGDAKDINLKYSEGWGEANKDTNFIAFNADYLLNALSGKSSILQLGERSDRAVAINTGSTSNILMPMHGSNEKMDYGNSRQEKKEADEKKATLKKMYRKANEDFIDSIKEKKGERFEKVSEVAANDLENRMAAMDDDTLKLNYDRLRFDLDKVMDKKEYITEDTKVDNKLKLSLRDAILYQTMAKNHPEVISKFADELEKRGISVKKSLFDDFLIDNFFEQDIDDMEEDEEEESLYNNYSAEQPELFNSTEFMVEEAFNRHCDCM